MRPVKDATAAESKTIWANGSAAANESALAVQFHSYPLAVGIAFATSDTIKGYILCMESAVNDNINRQPIALKVYNGTTLQATLKALGYIGPGASEWDTSTPESRTLADGDTLDANYTTVDGDYLVLEVGGQASAAGGSTVTGTMVFDASAATDLDESETDTVGAAWFEISRTLTFAADKPRIVQALQAVSRAAVR